LSGDVTFQRRLRRAFLRLAAATALLYGALVYLFALGTEEFLLRRYLGAVVEQAIAQIERPSTDGTSPSMLERAQALAPTAHQGAPRAPGVEVVRFYVRASPDLPAWAASYGQGTHRLDDGAMLRVVPIMGGGDTLYAVIDGDGILDIDDFEPYALLALLLIGAAVTSLSGAVAGMLARQLSMPLATLTREVNGHREGPVEFSGAQRGDEVGRSAVASRRWWPGSAMFFNANGSSRASRATSCARPWPSSRAVSPFCVRPTRRPCANGRSRACPRVRTTWRTWLPRSLRSVAVPRGRTSAASKR
jgi:hypothetical protein